MSSSAHSSSSYNGYSSVVIRILVGLTEYMETQQTHYYCDI